MLLVILGNLSFWVCSMSKSAQVLHQSEKKSLDMDPYKYKQLWLLISQGTASLLIQDSYLKAWTVLSRSLLLFRSCSTCSKARRSCLWTSAISLVLSSGSVKIEYDKYIISSQAPMNERNQNSLDFIIVRAERWAGIWNKRISHSVIATRFCT